MLFFNHGIRCRYCARRPVEFAGIHERIRDEEAEVLSISPDNVDDLKDYACEKNSPFLMLSDSSGAVSQRFTIKSELRRAPMPTILIADRFGVLRFQEMAEEADHLLDGNEILSWLSLIESECPECSHL